MHHQPSGESIWGNINTCMEIALDIYMIIAKDENGIEHHGVMARKSTAEKNLSSKAVSMAEQDGEWLCYDENTKDIPMYEVLQRRVAACKKIESAALKEMAEIKRDGKLSLTDYFGECLPPTQTQHGPVADMLYIRNGIYFTQDGNEMQFAVHEAVADNYMSAMAAEFGRRQGDYLFYDLATCAVALNELKNVFDEADALIVSEDSLYATLHKHFPAYTSVYNEMMQEEYQVPYVDGPTELFLQAQLEAVKSEAEESQPAHEAEHSESDFNEEVGYEI